MSKHIKKEEEEGVKIRIYFEKFYPTQLLILKYLNSAGVI